MERRHFLAGSTAVAAGAVLGGPFLGVASASAKGGPRPGSGYGELLPVPDQRDGTVRLHLPEGFSYRSFSPAGESLSDGSLIPGNHDGMAAFRGSRGSRGTTVLVRNHELGGPGEAFGTEKTVYDPAARGGTTTLVVTGQGRVLHSAASLSGTQMNCSGGPMPWGSWVSCEETVNGPDVGNDFTGGDNSLLYEKHGYLFEVPTDKAASARPVRAAGRFPHESVAFDPHTGALYECEDNFNFPSGFYRYLPPRDPRTTGALLDGGRLQMLAVRGEENADLSLGQRQGATYQVSWVDIDDPDPHFAPGTSNDAALQAVGAQGRAKGAAIFSRLEGCIYHQGTVYFVSTQGGATAEGDEPPSGFGDGRGQVWAYEPRTSMLRLMYESPDSMTLDLPDNVTASPRGTLVLCEDGDGDNYLRGLTASGSIFDFARMEPIAGDTGAEFAGSAFAPDGRTLFVNIQSKAGVSIAIWGPWHRGGF
ncbi:alkaline phosphatase PhoX [Streptomyces gobiensis]|uniref:alkaline phosphatase PhoX n=1 Tax=Streptomyces gobiensis TaxID=2875706 RepID=UPI001E59B526|nr:alkaline phosphatase PhoX [Streptomyces gobiensis]UGY93056.1 PhoX family protein [Streptomyces gobiensis]